MVDSCFQVSVFCICAAVIAVILKQYCREQSLLLTIFVCGAVMLGAAEMLGSVMSELKELFDTAGLDEEYTAIIFKSAAICIITDITKNICIDSGESAMAAAAVLWGKMTLTYMSMPLLLTIVDMIKEVL